MGKEEKNGLKINKKKFIRNIIIVLIALALAAAAFAIAPNFEKDELDDGKIHLIINNKNLTSSDRLSNDIFIENGVIYLSKDDVSRFFDTDLYYDAKYNQYITTSDTKVATLAIGEYKMEVNGINTPIAGTIIIKDDVAYLPFSEMKDIYNVEIQYIEATNIVLIDSLNREQIKAEASKNLSVKLKTKILSRTIDKVKQGEQLVIVSKLQNGWTRVRTASGKIGYVKTDKLQNEKIVRQNMEKEKQLEKVSMVWDYYSTYKEAPNRTGTTIPGINVVSPSFFELKKLGKGEILDKVGESGKKYIEWAKANNYKVWAKFSNESMIETISEIINDYKLRQRTIESIVDLAVRYGLDGINLDMENIYKEDKDMFTRFVIELSPRLKDLGMCLSVDVTAPDGGDNWSLCYDRDALADNSDYLVFMAYDQHNASSTKAGSVAGYNWVKANVNKFLGQEGVAAEKLILAIPLYTRLWTENSSGEIVNTSTVNMGNVERQIKGKGEKVWDETTRQNYIEYKQGNNTCKMWIEDLQSVKEKILLTQEKNLAGISFWAKGMEDANLWDMVNEMMFENK
ncbi:MAG: hypothetical protein IJ223_00095 [Clostridia bacterium]|nr:hypothetical protein [Clostridia bacterium]